MAENLPMAPPVRLMNFVSEDQLDEAKRSRGERVEDGTAQRDRPLFEILKENKDKQDAEFNERFKHRPPKALDEDETEFLDRLEISRKEYERQIADEEAQQLRMFQVAVASQSSVIQDSIETPASDSRVSLNQDEKRATGKKKQPPQPLGMIIKVKQPNKKAKVDPPTKQPSGAEVQTCSSPRKCSDGETAKEPLKNSDRNVENIHVVTKTGLGLVSYSDESDDDD